MFESLIAGSKRRDTIPETLAMMLSFLLKEIRFLEDDKVELRKKIDDLKYRFEDRNTAAKCTEDSLRRQGAEWRAKAEAAEKELARLKKKEPHSKKVKEQ